VNTLLTIRGNSDRLKGSAKTGTEVNTKSYAMERMEEISNSLLSNCCTQIILNCQTIKTIRIIKAATTCFGSHKTIIREPQPVLS
jgi:hypothetical protein